MSLVVGWAVVSRAGMVQCGVLAKLTVLSACSNQLREVCRSSWAMRRCGSIGTDF